MLRGNLQKRLSDAREELLRAREALRIIDEQVSYQQEIADAAETDAVVAETPLAHREYRDAGGDLQRLRREREELQARVARLITEQDELLDRLLEDSR